MPKKEALEETHPASTLILNFQPPELRENEFWLFKPAGQWFVVMAALAKEYSWLHVLASADLQPRVPCSSHWSHLNLTSFRPHSSRHRECGHRLCLHLSTSLGPRTHSRWAEDLPSSKPPWGGDLGVGHRFLILPSRVVI